MAILSIQNLIRRLLRVGVVLGAFAAGIGFAQAPKAPTPAPAKAATAGAATTAVATSVATFAGGCFWCMEPPYDKLPGVISTTSGYMGGASKNPTYGEVSAGGSGHTEVVQVVYDPAKVDYDKLLEVYWKNVDPTVKDRQFCDVGSQYRTTIFVHTEEQRRLAQKSKDLLAMTKPFKDPIVVPVVAAVEFWPAEEYHQDYYIKNPVRYNYYRTGCGRDERLKQLWGAPPG